MIIKHVFFFILFTFCLTKLFNSNQIVDDAKCKIEDIIDANEFINPILNQLRVIEIIKFTIEKNFF